MRSPNSPPVLKPSGRRWALRLALPTGCAALLIAALSAVPRSESAPSPSDNHVMRLAAGQRLVYQADFDSSSTSDPGALFADAQTALRQVFEVHIQGELALSVLEADARHARVVYQFRAAEVRFQADGRSAPEQARAVGAELARPVLALLDGRGRVLSLWFDPATGALAQHLTRTLLAATQVVGPASGDDPKAGWDAEEDDPNGTLIAHYRVETDGTVHKTKVRYLEPKAEKRNRRTIFLTPTIRPQGQYVATIDAAGCLVALSAADSQDATVQGKLVGQARLEFDMRLLRKEQSSPGELAALRSAASQLAAAARAVGLFVAPSPQESRLAIQRQELGGATLASLLADLAKAEAAPRQDKEAMRLFLKFKALAILHPESCARLGELLSTAEVGSLKMGVLADALEAAGDAPAQAALSAAIHARSRDTKTLQRLIPALGAAESPTPETEKTLQALAFQDQDKKVGATALLALGNLARSLGEEQPARAAKIVDRLLGQLAAPASADSRWLLLLALGNAGSTRALPVLTGLLDDSAPNLRGAAAWALRWIDSPKADLLLTNKVLSGDRNPQVRLEAARALRFRKETPANFHAQEKALAAEPEANVRLALLGNLWEERQTYPQVRRLVEKIAASDPAPVVRQSAAKLLKSAFP